MTLEERIRKALVRALINPKDMTPEQMLDRMVSTIEVLRIRVMTLEDQLSEIWGEDTKE